MTFFKETVTFITGTKKKKKKPWALIFLFPPNIVKLKSHNVHFSFSTKKIKKKKKKKKKERKTKSNNTSANVMPRDKQDTNNNK